MSGKPRNGCYGKRRYKDSLAALIALSSTNRAGRDERRAYRLPGLSWLPPDASTSGEGWFLMPDVQDIIEREHTPESEPVLIEAVGEAVVFVLDDGERLEFDRVELLSALGAEVAGDMGRLRAA